MIHNIKFERILMFLYEDCTKVTTVNLLEKFKDLRRKKHILYQTILYIFLYFSAKFPARSICFYQHFSNLKISAIKFCQTMWLFVLKYGIRFRRYNIHAKRFMCPLHLSFIAIVPTSRLFLSVQSSSNWKSNFHPFEYML